MKRTNKIWKGLALLLVLCMLPTVALASSGATMTIVGDVTEAEGVITVNAHTTVPGNDITILAFRAGESAEEIPADAELEGSLVFIDQVTSDDDGNATFSFIPRAVDPSKGGFVHIYVGGENMTGEPAHTSIDNRPPAPVFTTLPTAWYAGHDELDFAVAEDLEYVEAWAETVEAIKVTGYNTEDEPVEDNTEIVLPTDMTVSEGKITFDVTGLKSISKIAIDGGDVYTATDATFTTPLVQTDIPAGTLTATPSGTISPVTVSFSAFADAAGVPVTDWAVGAAIRGNYKWAKADGETAKEDLVYAAFEAGTGTDFVLEEATGEAEYYIQLAIANCVTTYYGPYTVTSALKADIDALTAGVLYGEGATEKYTSENAAVQGEFYQTIPEGDALAEFLALDLADQKEQYGKATIALDDAGDNGSTITWTAAVDGGDADPVSGIYEIERNAVGGDAKAVVLVATIENNGNSDTKTFNLTVNPLGVSGVDVSITLTGGVAKGATVKLMDGDIEVAELVAQGDFTFHKTTTDATYNTVIFASEDKVAAGEYTLVISRPGFVTKSQAVTVADEDLVIPTLAATDFVFGDNRGMTDATPDGKVLTPDYNALCVAFKVEGNYALALDYNGDGVVETIDYNALCSNFNYGK